MICQQTISLEVLPGCTPTVGPIPPPSPLTFYPPSVYVANWNSIKGQLVAPTADPAGVQTEWDGTLPVQDTASFPGFSFWYVSGTAPPVFVGRASNGYLGPDGGIYLIQGGGSAWLLEIDCTVAGFPDILWVGEKALGVCPTGTYMRLDAFSLSDGPECMIVESTQPCPAVMAWWRMEDVGVIPQVDSVISANLVLSFGVPGDFSLSPGKVGSAIKCKCLPGVSGVGLTTPLLSLMAFNGSGVTIAFWAQITELIPDVHASSVVEYTFYRDAVQHLIRVHMTGLLTGGSWIATVDGVGFASVAAAVGWNFISATYDAASGFISLDINQSGPDSQMAVALPGGVNSTGAMSIGTSEGGFPGSIEFEVDELAVYHGVLTGAQLGTLYNGGAGHTWPF